MLTRRALCATGIAAGAVPATAAGDGLSDAAVRALLAARVAAVSGGEGGFGIVAARSGRPAVAAGQLDAADRRSPGGDTRFEIGSLTKVFTGLLLAEMASRGEVALDDPVACHLPGLRLPEGGAAITLLDLATHTSGLPFMPPAGAGDLRTALGGVVLTSRPGAAWAYSNLGYELLGEALAARAARPYEPLLQDRVLKPLRLATVSYAPAPAAPGHDAALERAPNLVDVPAYAGLRAAGGLFGGANDLLRFVTLAMGAPGPLAAAFRLSLEPRRPTGEPGARQALGWTVFGEGRGVLVFRDGGTLGAASCMAFTPATRRGVAVLANQVTAVADIARHLLDPTTPLAHPQAARHVEVTLDPAVLDSYAGRYEAEGEGVFRIGREGTGLAIDAPDDWGLPHLRLHADGARDFFVRELPLRARFQVDGQGRVTGVLIYPPRGQKAVPARRLP